jgi:hypothetical protein
MNTRTLIVMLMGLMLATHLPRPGLAVGGAQAYYEAAKIAQRRGCLGRALCLVDEALEMMPDNGQYQWLRGTILHDMGLARAAVKQLERARLSGDAVGTQRANETLQELGVDHRSTPLILGPDGQ